MPLLGLPDAEIWYEDTGDGVPVLFVHPAAASSAGWEHQVRPSWRPATAASPTTCEAGVGRGSGRA